MFVVFFMFFSKLRDGLMNLVGWNPFRSGDTKGNAPEAVEQKQNTIKQTPVKSESLKRNRQAYQTIAQAMQDAMSASGTDGGTLLELHKGLNVEELKQVYKEFGIRDNKIFGLTAMTGNLIEWFIYECTDAYDKKMLLPELQKIWKPTRLWV